MHALEVIMLRNDRAAAREFIDAVEAGDVPAMKAIGRATADIAESVFQDVNPWWASRNAVRAAGR